MDKKCGDCQEPTKHSVGFWDGADNHGGMTGGLLFDCNNTACAIKKAAIASEEEKRRQQAVARDENEKNGISAEYFIQLRRKVKLTLRACADFLGIGPVEMSGYEREQTPFPTEYWNRIITHMLGLHIVEPCEDKYNHVRTLTFIGEQHGACEDLYITKETGIILIRQCLDDATVRWLTANKWSGGYEADCPVKDGLILNVVDVDGKSIFTEITYHTEWNGGGQAEKKHPFSWEKV